jgi:hypothetical protein
MSQIVMSWNAKRHETEDVRDIHVSQNITIT